MNYVGKMGFSLETVNSDESFDYNLFGSEFLSEYLKHIGVNEQLAYSLTSSGSFITSDQCKDIVKVYNQDHDMTEGVIKARSSAGNNPSITRWGGVKKDEDHKHVSSDIAFMKDFIRFCQSGSRLGGFKVY